MLKKHEVMDPKSCLNKAHLDEMVFVLLGRDAAAPAAIRTWCMERVRIGKNQAGDDQIMDALACAEAMEAAQ